MKVKLFRDCDYCGKPTAKDEVLCSDCKNKVRCKICLRKYDKSEVIRTLGQDFADKGNFCSAFCYTRYTYIMQIEKG